MNDLRQVLAKSGTNHEGTSAHNRRVIIDALRLNESLSRAELARATNLTKQTVSNLMDSLEQEGLVRPLNLVRSGRGQPSTPYGLVADGAFAIGLQIDRHVARVVAVNLVGDQRAKAEGRIRPDDPAGGTLAILELIETVRRQLRARHRQADQRMTGLGIAMPGPFGLNGADDNPWMMPAWQAYPVTETLARGTGLQISFQNDAAAFATAERMVGKAKGLDHAVCIYIGHGIGAGLILGGELYSGAHGNAGEVGMALLSDGGRLTPLEHKASMASLYQHLGLDPALDSSKALFDLVAKNDPRLDTWVAKAAFDLRWAIHLVETVFDPQSIILSGGASETLMRRLFDAIIPLLPSLSVRAERQAPRLQLGMTDPWSVALGAASAPIGLAFEPRFAAILKQNP